MEESATVLSQARSLCERRLAGAPDDEAAAAALAELLPEADAAAGWTVLRPDVMASAAGATLTGLPDGSVLAVGPNPPVDTYTLEATIGQSGITALRLEALTDPSLPGHGPGRQPQPRFSGNFFLTSIRLSTVVGPSAPDPIVLPRARADYSDRSSFVQGVSGAIDADPNSHWSILPLMGRPHQAVFQAARPIRPRPGMRLRLELVCGLENEPYATLGRFRLSVTDRPFPLFQPSLEAIKADTERGGLTRLGAAYVLLGDWAPAAAVLARAAARPDALALDDFLLALARHHLGRLDEARGDCDRGLARSGGVMADEFDPRCGHRGVDDHPGARCRRGRVVVSGPLVPRQPIRSVVGRAPPLIPGSCRARLKQSWIFRESSAREAACAGHTLEARRRAAMADSVAERPAGPAGAGQPTGDSSCNRSRQPKTGSPSGRSRLQSSMAVPAHAIRLASLILSRIWHS